MKQVIGMSNIKIMDGEDLSKFTQFKYNCKRLWR